jgi:hypothetical protein
MASNLACVGLGLSRASDLGRLLESVLPRSSSLGSPGGVDVRRWEDPSGARLVFRIREGKLVDLLPSCAGEAGGRLAAVRPLTDDVSEADVVDGEGETVTRLAFELEERQFLDSDGEPAGGEATLVALGMSVSCQAGEDAFARARASILHYDGVDEEAATRVAPESFIPIGLFGAPTAHARLHGTVLSSQLVTVEETGQTFVRSLVRTAGFEAAVCAPEGTYEAEPEPGNILGGHVFLVGSMPSLLP